MSKTNVAGWLVKPLGELAEPRRGITYSSEMLEAEEGGLPYINMKSFIKGGGFNPEGTKTYTGFYTPNDLVGERDLLIANTDVTAGDIVGVPALLPPGLATSDVLYSHHVTRLRLNGEVSVPFLYYLLCLPEYRSQMLRIARGTTVLMLDMQAINRVSIRAPKAEKTQQRIVEILSTVDDAIEEAEVLLAKWQQMKVGLMHDLFTRGVTTAGHLRPNRTEAPDLYQKSPLGWIPKEWRSAPIGKVIESLVDGPFGSNLKTEHYVAESGVRVVRLQNIDEGAYNDSDRAFVSDRHAEALWRNRVKPGDVLVAGLGEDNNFVGRACCYPSGLPQAINKADCFRLRSNSQIVINAYVMFFLNTAAARWQVRRYEQGVTRRRINTSNLKRVWVTLPSLAEQETIVRALNDAGAHIDAIRSHSAKLRQQKQGLMFDLLTGRVRLSID
jgi:type I restriction enzyme, S subunit